VTAVDTNVLVRLVTEDDLEQPPPARSLFEEAPIWIARTVLLETNWVVRSLYRFDESAIREAFNKLLGLHNVRAEDEPSVAAALALTAQGVDFADALHLSSRPPGAKFVSFDRSFVRRTKLAGVAEVCSLMYTYS
jgi:predicted nucleic-acid-binding protein